jgi:hypothetical protein
LYRDGRSEPYLREVQALALRAPNFELLDDQDQVRICCLTQRPRTTLASYSRRDRDGCIVLVDAKRGTRGGRRDRLSKRGAN